MKFKGTWSLLIIVLLLALYAYFGEYKKDIEDQKTKEAEMSLLKSKIDQINFITLQTKKEKIILTKSADGWKLEEPIKDWADNDAVESLISPLTDEKYIEIAKEGDGINWSEYGLDQPESTLTLKTQGGEETTFEISSKKNFEGNSLLRVNHKNQALVVNPVWLSRGQRSAFELRQRNFLRAKAASIDSLKIKNKDLFFELENKDGKWIFPKFPKQIVEQNKVREFLAALNEIKAAEILLEKTPTTDELKKYSLDKPLVTIEAKIKDKIWKAAVVQNKEKFVYAQTSDPLFVMRLDAGVIDKFQKLNPAQMRDRSYPFILAKADIKSVDLSDSLKKMHFELLPKVENKTADLEWQIIPASPEFDIQQDLLKSLPDRLKKIEATGFLDPIKDFKPDNSLVLREGPGGKIIFQMDWMKLKKIKVNGEEQNVHIAKTNLSDEFLALESSTVDSLKLNELIKPKPKTDKKDGTQ